MLFASNDAQVLDESRPARPTLLQAQHIDALMTTSSIWMRSILNPGTRHLAGSPSGRSLVSSRALSYIGDLSISSASVEPPCDGLGGQLLPQQIFSRVQCRSDRPCVAIYRSGLPRQGLAGSTARGMHHPYVGRRFDWGIRIDDADSGVYVPKRWEPKIEGLSEATAHENRPIRLLTRSV